MTVEELIQKLSQYPKDTPIYFVDYQQESYIEDGSYYDSDVTFEDLFTEVDYDGLALEVVQ